MVDQPTLEYELRTFKSDIELMNQVESLIPGCMVYVRSFNTRKVRLKNANPEYLCERDEWVVKAPLHAAWLFESMLKSAQVNFWCRATTGQIVTPWSNNDESRDWSSDVCSSDLWVRQDSRNDHGRLMPGW